MTLARLVQFANACGPMLVTGRLLPETMIVLGMLTVPPAPVNPVMAT